MFFLLFFFSTQAFVALSAASSDTGKKVFDVSYDIGMPTPTSREQGRKLISKTSPPSSGGGSTTQGYN